MTTDRTSAGEPARTLRLLWRAAESEQSEHSEQSERPGRGRRGPRRGSSVDEVVAAAISVADREGPAATTMRRVAQELGVVPMTLYTYVPGKAELLDLMLDTLYARMPRTSTAGQPWRRRVAAVAEENRALYREHPWAAAVSTVRPPLGPGQMAKYEHELAALDGLGLSDVELDDCLTHLLAFVQAAARTAADVQAARRDSAMSDRRWWEANAPLLERVLDESAYPRAVRVGAAAGAAHGSAHDPEHAYAFGLERVLDAFEVLVERR